MTGKLQRAAFSLVEVCLALGVAAFCLIAVFGLLPVGLNSNKTSVEQTAAVNLLTALISDLRSTPSGVAASPAFGLSTTAPTVIYLKEDGTTGSKAEARYRVQSKMAAPGSGRSASTGNILISWPAQQDDTAKAAGWVETFVALDRN